MEELQAFLRVFPAVISLAVIKVDEPDSLNLTPKGDNLFRPLLEQGLIALFESFRAVARLREHYHFRFDDRGFFYRLFRNLFHHGEEGLRLRKCEDFLYFFGLIRHCYAPSTFGGRHFSTRDCGTQDVNSEDRGEIASVVVREFQRI